jgi:putative transposase
MLHLTDTASPIPGLRPAGSQGQVHLVVFDTHEQRHHFAEAAAASTAARALQASTGDGGTRLLAWVLLPDRWHGLVEVAPHDALPRFVARIKAAMARSLRDADPQRERIWSTTWQDRPLRTDGMILECARHLVLSPVRAGLVEHAVDYPFWDAIWFDPPRQHAWGAAAADADADAREPVGAA